MKGILIFLAGLVLGGIATFFAGTGVGAGAGIVTGLKAGACLTVEAAKDKGFVSADQVDEVLNAALQQIASEDLAEVDVLASSDAECQKVVAEMKAAASEAK